MVDFEPIVKEKLDSILPTYYELFLDDKSIVPCISYQQIENGDLENGNNLGYSRITFRIKVWAKTVRDLTIYANRVDDAMSDIGRFIRIATNDLANGDLLCRIVDYSATYREFYNNVRYT